MNECIFCKIAAGKIPSYKVYEDNHFFAFLDITPRNKGHTLVIPKEHHRWVWDVKNSGEYFAVSSRIAKALKVALGTDYVVSCIFGEEVPHAHIHLIPRFPNDGHSGSINMAVKKEFSRIEMQDACAKIIAALAHQ